MAGKKHYKQINIDVEPFLSIMAIVLKLVSLILVVIVMRIAVNAEGKKIVVLTQWRGHTTSDKAKEPRYIDCYHDYVIMYPSKLTNTFENLQQPNNAVENMLTEVEKNAAKEYVVVMARPDTVKIFRAIRKMISERKIDVGYDVVDADFKVDWDKAVKALAVSK